MSNILNISILKEERSALRILGIIERRGFDVVYLNLFEAKKGTLSMCVHIDNRYEGFKAETLVRQLNQTHLVVQATLETNKSNHKNSTPSKTTEMSATPAAFSSHEVPTHSKYAETVR